LVLVVGAAQSGDGACELAPGPRPESAPARVLQKRDVVLDAPPRRAEHDPRRGSTVGQEAVEGESGQLGLREESGKPGRERPGDRGGRADEGDLALLRRLDGAGRG
jgi:hypothetical protein